VRTFNTAIADEMIEVDLQMAEPFGILLRPAFRAEVEGSTSAQACATNEARSPWGEPGFWTDEVDPSHNLRVKGMKQVLMMELRGLEP